jgi:phospholipid/cholesterol/gamma-HCH transport system substrate-binding protein
MAKSTRKYFAMGLFVTLAIFIAVFTIIPISESRDFEKGTRYVTFFDESVEGLSKGSEVKYQGVPVGRVEDIRIARDKKLIAVTMLIDLRDNLPSKVVAQLNKTGTAGLRFINLAPKRSDGPDLSPKLTFPTEYPVISSKPSDR